MMEYSYVGIPMIFFINYVSIVNADNIITIKYAKGVDYGDKLAIFIMLLMFWLFETNFVVYGNSTILREIVLLLSIAFFWIRIYLWGAIGAIVTYIITMIVLYILTALILEDNYYYVVLISLAMVLIETMHAEKLRGVRPSKVDNSSE